MLDSFTMKNSINEIWMFQLSSVKEDAVTINMLIKSSDTES